MRILITGAKGFIGKNLIARLNSGDEKHMIYSYDIDSKFEDLEQYVKDCEFVFNFAAVHRPKETDEFDKTNHLFFDELLAMLQKNNNKCPVLYTSSIQATNGTPYGNSKLAAENDLRCYAEETGARAVIYRLTNTFGRWATPNHHSVVATFCYNIARGLPIVVSDPDMVMYFYYIDDVIDSFVDQLTSFPVADDDGIYRLPAEKIYTLTLGELARILQGFKDSLDKGNAPKTDTMLEQNLYTTYLSYVEG